MAFEKYGVIDKVIKSALLAERNDSKLGNFVNKGDPRKVTPEERIVTLERKLHKEKLSFSELDSIREEIKKLQLKLR